MPDIKTPSLQPCWDRPRHLQYVRTGAPLEGRRVLIRCYHGLGDTLQYIRFAPLVKRVASRVMAEREDSPWYPTMRLFRQREPGSWKSVTERVVLELGKWVKAKNRRPREYTRKLSAIRLTANER